MITLLAGYAGVEDTTPIRFSEPKLDNRYTVGDIKRYGLAGLTFKLNCRSGFNPLTAIEPKGFKIPCWISSNFR
jgi:hypothetical protein